MTPDELAHTIQLILAPVVMITACALTMNGVMSHYQAVSNRLRALVRERIELLHGNDKDETLARERVREIDHEAPELLHRHQLLHYSLLGIATAMALLVVCMLVIAITSVTGSAAFGLLVLVLFLLGTLFLLIGLVLSAIDIGLSRRAVAYEVERVLKLARGPRNR